MSRRSHYRSHKPSRPGQPATSATAAGEQPPARDPAVTVPSAPPPAVQEQPPIAGEAVAGLPPLRQPPPAGHPNGNGHAPSTGPSGPAAAREPTDRPAHVGAAGCTAPQLRRFIKSRSWVPMHELRRRFAINGSEDDVTPVSVEGLTIFVGLPSREGRLLGELFQAGDIGYELSMDPRTPVVIGVYPMRPVPRH